jgi:hypothetical protein
MSNFLIDELELEYPVLYLDMARAVIIVSEASG